MEAIHEKPAVEVPHGAVCGMVREGTLEAHPFAELFVTAVREGLDGTLEVRAGRRRRAFVFEGGKPVAVRSAEASDRLPWFLARAGRLDEATARRVDDEAIASGSGAAEILFARGLLPAAELAEAMTAHLESVCVDTFGWVAGVFTFDAGPAPAARTPVSLSTARVIAAGFARHASDRAVGRVMPVPDDAVPRPTASCGLTAEALPLGPAESRVRDLAASGVTVGRIVASSELPSHKTRAVLRILVALGAIELAQPEARPAASPAPPAASPAPPAPAVRAVPRAGLPDLEEAVGPEARAKGRAADLWAGLRALEAGEPANAAERFSRAAAAGPRDPTARLYLGWATYAASAEAIRAAEDRVLEAARLDRASPLPFLLLAEIWEAEGQPERALHFRDLARKLRRAGDPHGAVAGSPAPSAHGVLARIARALGDRGRAPNARRA